jgi:hypothetical protein
VTETGTCSVCGTSHPLEELELSFKLPDPVAALDDADRTQRCRGTEDVYVLDHRRYFVRGLLSLPVRGREMPYRLGMWAEVPQHSFERIWTLWDDPDQAEEPPLPGQLANSVPGLADSVGLSVRVWLSGPTTRPEFEVLPSAHQLYSEQNEGICEHRAFEYSRHIPPHASA